MGKRLDLHSKLVEALGSNKVYFQPPASVKMSYPAIRYSLGGIERVNANDDLYGANKYYEVTYLTTDPDDITVDKLIKFKNCRFDRMYVADNLYHYVYTIYF